MLSYISKCSPVFSVADIWKTSPLTVKQLHGQLITNGIRSPFIFSKIIEYYCLHSSNNNSSHHHAIHIFTHFHRPHIFLFNTLIRCLHPPISIPIFFTWFSNPRLKFDELTYTYALGACVRSTPLLSTILQARQIHTQAFKLGILSSSIFVHTTTLHFYATNHSLPSARKLFDETPHPINIVTWNAMISGYCAHKEENKDHPISALSLFTQLLVQTRPSDTTMVCVLSAASHLGVLETGLCLHGYVEKTFHEPERDLFIGTGLIGMYSKCGCLSVSLLIFGRMEERSVLTWTAVMTGLALHGEGGETLKLMRDMKGVGLRPNSVTFTSLLSACCHSGLVEEGVWLFNNMGECGITPQARHYGCVVDLLGRAGCLEEAYAFIMGTPMRSNRVLWRALLNACRVHGDTRTGERIGEFLVKHQLEKRGGCLDYVALSNVYASAEKWDRVESIRREMKCVDVGERTGWSLVSARGRDSFKPG